MMRVMLPQHLRSLAQVGREIELEIAEPGTIGAVLDGLEEKYPVLRGTIRDQINGLRRPFIRFFCCGQDWSLAAVDTALPEEVLTGKEPLRVVGAMAGG
jgi:hypothetical protein